MQRLGLLGLSYRTADQGCIARAAAASPTGDAIRKVHADCGLVESVLLSTCNRVEWVFAVSEEASLVDAFAALEARLPVAPSECYRLAGEEVARHIFEVAASLDSMNPGETQIVGQVREAYRRAGELGLVGPRLHLVFDAALKAAKRVRRETALAARPVSMMSLALEAAGDLPAGATVAVVGAGEMAREAAERLGAGGSARRREGDAAGPRLVFANRTLAKAEALAARCGAGARAVAVDEFLARPPALDVLISAVSVAEPLFTREVLERVARAAVGGAAAVILDLGVPANVDLAAARTLGFRAFGMDDLKARGETHRRQLELEIAAARRVLEAELEEFRGAMLERTLAPVLAAWRERAHYTLDEGLARLFSSENGRWNEDERERIERWAASLVERLAALPAIAMREMAVVHGVETAHTFLAALGASLESGESAAGERPRPAAPRVGAALS